MKGTKLNKDIEATQKGNGVHCRPEIDPEDCPAMRKWEHSVRAIGAKSGSVIPQGTPAYTDRHGYMQNSILAALSNVAEHWNNSKDLANALLEAEFRTIQSHLRLNIVTVFNAHDARKILGVKYIGAKHCANLSAVAPIFRYIHELATGKTFYQ